MSSEYGGTRSRAAKVNTEKGSEEKNNLIKAGFQQRHSYQPTSTSTEDLNSATFRALRPATFKNTTKMLLGYANLKYGHYTGQDIRTRQPKAFNFPANPSDKNMDNDMEGAKYWWQDECMDMMAKKRGYTAILFKMFPSVLGWCHKDLLGKVQNCASFDSLESSGGTLIQIKAIDQEGYGFRSAYYTPVAYHQA